jgi:magnesium chelatase subunit I
MEKLVKLNVGPKENPESQVSAAEFVLEGLHAHKRIGRNEERLFTAGEKPQKAAEKPFEREDQPFRGRRPFN